MNIFLLSLIDKSIGDAMVRLANLPLQPAILSPVFKRMVVGLTEKVFNTYLNFFISVHVIPNGYEYNNAKITRTFESSNLEMENLDLVDKKLLNFIKGASSVSVIPVNFRINQLDELFWYIGIGIFENTDQSSEFFLHNLSISTKSIRYSSANLHYLDSIFEKSPNPAQMTPRRLAAAYGKNYNQFQKDCKSHFGDTFHQFQNKMKMLDVISDVLFTRFSFKEIAYRNDFYNYNSMYSLFKKKYNFPIDAIPRLLSEI